MGVGVLHRRQPGQGPGLDPWQGGGRQQHERVHALLLASRAQPRPQEATGQLCQLGQKDEDLCNEKLFQLVIRYKI